MLHNNYLVKSYYSLAEQNGKAAVEASKKLSDDCVNQIILLYYLSIKFYMKALCTCDDIDNDADDFNRLFSIIDADVCKLNVDYVGLLNIESLALKTLNPQVNRSSYQMPIADIVKYHKIISDKAIEVLGNLTMNSSQKQLSVSALLAKAEGRSLSPEVQEIAQHSLSYEELRRSVRIIDGYSVWIKNEKKLYICPVGDSLDNNFPNWKDYSIERFGDFDQLWQIYKTTKWGCIT